MDEDSFKLEAVHSIEYITHADHSIAFLHFVTLTLNFWPNINWWMRYHGELSLCQFWQFSFKPFWFYRPWRRYEFCECPLVVVGGFRLKQIPACWKPKVLTTAVGNLWLYHCRLAGSTAPQHCCQLDKCHLWFLLHQNPRLKVISGVINTIKADLPHCVIDGFLWT